MSGFSFQQMAVLIAAICRQFSTSFAHAFTQTDFTGFSVLRTFASMPEHPSVSNILMSLTGPRLLPSRILRSMRTPWECVGLSTSPRKIHNLPYLQAVFGWPFLKVLHNFQGFCTICDITVERAFCLSQHLRFRQLLRSMLFSPEFARGCPLLSVHLL